MSYIVNFLSVGRNRSSWSATLPNVDNHTVCKEIQQRGVLMSKDVRADTDLANGIGVIVVGGFREVGTFTFRRFDQSTSLS